MVLGGKQPLCFPLQNFSSELIEALSRHLASDGNLCVSRRAVSLPPFRPHPEHFSCRRRLATMRRQGRRSQSCASAWLALGNVHGSAWRR
jgi:hypothetical protein